MKLRTVGHHVIKSGTATRDEGKNTFRYYIGIDPDLTSSGIAVYDKERKKLIGCASFSFFELFSVLKRYKAMHAATPNSLVIHIEGAWLESKSNWHTRTRKATYTSEEKSIGERIAKNVGNNQAAGRLIVEMCIYLSLSFVVREPLHPRFNDETLFKRFTGWKGKTNKDARSAANYVFGF